MCERIAAVEEAELLKLSVQELLERLASPSPEPGAGSTAALVAALGAGLVGMAAGASKEHWPDAGGAAAQAVSLRKRLAPLAEENAETYVAALEALASRSAGAPGSADPEIGASLDRAALVLASIAEAAADVAELAAIAADRCVPELRPDAASAALLGETASRVALTLIEANLITVRGGDVVQRVRSITVRANAAVERALATADGVN